MPDPSGNDSGKSGSVFRGWPCFRLWGLYLTSGFPASFSRSLGNRISFLSISLTIGWTEGGRVRTILFAAAAVAAEEIVFFILNSWRTLPPKLYASAIVRCVLPASEFLGSVGLTFWVSGTDLLKKTGKIVKNSPKKIKKKPQTIWPAARFFEKA